MTEQSTQASLYRKIAAVAGAIGRVEKDGYNPQLKYRYATPATVMEAVKPLLADHHLAIVPQVSQIVKEATGSKTQGGAEKVLTRVEMTYLILDGDSGESIAVPWAGEGEDWSDKGIAKAQTIALRTFLINLFQIPSGDDDPDAGQQQPASRAASYEPPRQQPPGRAEKTQDTPKAPKRAVSRQELIDKLQVLWRREKELGGVTPVEDIAIDLDDPDEATIEEITKRGKAAAARVRRLETEAEMPV